MVRLAEQDIKTTEVLDWQGVHLIHFSGSSCSQKTRIFLNLKGIDWISHPLDLAAQDSYRPWFLGINPRGLVPVLVHDGAVHIFAKEVATPAPLKVLTGALHLVQGIRGGSLARVGGL